MQKKIILKFKTPKEAVNLLATITREVDESEEPLSEDDLAAARDMMEQCQEYLNQCN